VNPMPARVTQVSPSLRVRLEHATTDSAAVNLDAKTFSIGDRVAVVAYGSRLLVLGKET